jgi:putative transposase
MLDTEEFDIWCKALNLSQSARILVEQIRRAPPSRQVQGYRRNVCGCYPSRKMGVTIGFESHHNELARIYELEYDPDVLEYYDQPPAIELVYLTKHGRKHRHLCTPDFFVIRTHSASWEECKPESELVLLANHNPNRYCKGTDQQWHCLPAEAYAIPFGFYFHVHSDAVINWTFQQNLIWLEDYLTAEPTVPEATITQPICALVNACPGITLTDLMQQLDQIGTDNFYWLIATRQVYVDLYAARLAESSQVRVFLNQEIAQAYKYLASAIPLTVPQQVQPIQVKVGTSLSWDGQFWDIVNTGVTTVGLLRSDGTFTELPNSAFEQLIEQNRIAALEPIALDSSLLTAKEILQHATSNEIAEANRRYGLLAPYLSNPSPSNPPSTIRRWRSQYRQAATLYGSGYIGLLPAHSHKGNRVPKVDKLTSAFMLQFIEQHYETLTQRRKLHVYEAFAAACETHEPKLTPPSRITFCRAIKQRAGYDQTRKRQGHRAAIQKEPFHWELTLTTPRQGSRPFEIVHIDHTQLDIELVSSLVSLTNCSLLSHANNIQHNLGRPWATFIVDAFSRRLLAVYLSFDPPSYRACMMTIRICVQRFKRLPQTIVVDNGAEFHSHYFEQLLAYYVCTKKHRPVAHARFGSVVERLFGTANTQLIHELQGNTQITRQVRQITKFNNPEQLAIWTLGDLYQALCQWAYQVYDTREHPALGQSPRQAFEMGLAIGGSRTHQHIAYDELFHILTLPAPEQRLRKVQPGQGIKLHNIYYWSNAFRDPEIEKSNIEVRYDPFDAGVAYALVRGQWVKCISAYYQYLQGLSEREIQLISIELKQRKRNYEQRLNTTDRALVEFLNSQQAKEGQFLEQRLRDAEHKTVLQQIHPQTRGSDTQDLSSSSLSSFDRSSCQRQLESCSEREISYSVSPIATESLDYYGEF